MMRKVNSKANLGDNHQSQIRPGNLTTNVFSPD